MKEYLYQFIPDRFLYLSENKKIKYKDKNLKSDYLINLLHEFIIKYFFSNDTISLRINLYSLILRKKYGMNYNYYIEYLLDNGFIKLTSNYFVNKKSKTYQINYFDITKLKRVRIYDKILLKKYNRFFLEKSITEFDSSPINLNIRKKLINSIYNVKIDFEKSLNYLNDLKEKKLIDDNKYYKNIISINGIKDKHLFFKFDSYGRFHTNYTILKKFIRNNYLKINNEKVCELDIKNSQPLFLTILINKYIKDWKEFDDIVRYFFVVNNGIIYDDIINRYPKIKNREDAKMLIFKVFFGKNNKNDKSCIAFKKLYPNVYDFIYNYKEKMGDYKKLSHELQKIESEFIFNIVLKKVFNSIKNINIITVHDSIIFQCKYAEKIEKIFYEELNKLKISN